MLINNYENNELPLIPSPAILYKLITSLCFILFAIFIFFLSFCPPPNEKRGGGGGRGGQDARRRSWLRHCTTSRKVAGSIPDGVTGIFVATIALGSTQPLTEMSIRIFPGGKGGLCLALTTLPPPCADCLEILEASTSWNPKGLSKACSGIAYKWEGIAVVELVAFTNKGKTTQSFMDPPPPLPARGSSASH